MTQRLAAITTLRRKLYRAEFDAENVAHVQSRIADLERMSDEQYEVERRRAGNGEGPK